jgi:hypothetical protein
MPQHFKPIDLDGIQTYPLKDRPSKVDTRSFARPWTPGGRLSDFLDHLPRILAGDDLRAVIDAVAAACRQKRTVVMGMGGHVIKVGLNPLVIDLMRRGVLSAVAMNGAGIIHDLEVALAGKTSEDVAAALGSGSFGMARETAEHINAAVREAGATGIGLGAAVGRRIADLDMPFADRSILCAGVRCGLPVTVHVALGTDIVHMHPGFDPALAGEASHRDFRLFAAVAATLQEGVYLNVGSAVVLPEVFLKAITLVRNLGHPVSRLTTVNMDFIRQYRPMTNVVNRPTLQGGRGISLVGHHEIMFPLLAAGVIERIEGCG